MDTPHTPGPLGMVPSAGPSASVAAAAAADASPYDAAALKTMVERLRRDLGGQLVSLAGGGTGFLRLNS